MATRPHEPKVCASLSGFKVLSTARKLGRIRRFLGAGCETAPGRREGTRGRRPFSRGQHIRKPSEEVIRQSVGKIVGTSVQPKATNMSIETRQTCQKLVATCTQPYLEITAGARLRKGPSCLRAQRINIRLIPGTEVLPCDSLSFAIYQDRIIASATHEVESTSSR